MAALNIESFCNVTPYSACQNFGKSQARESAPSAGSIAGARVSQVLQQPWLPADKAALGAAETARYPPSSIRKHERESAATRHNQPTKTTAEMLVSHQLQHRAVPHTTGSARGLHTRGSSGVTQRSGVPGCQRQRQCQPLATALSTCQSC